MKKSIVAVKFLHTDNNGFIAEKEYSYFTRIELAKFDWVIVVVNDILKTAQVVNLENELSKAQKAKTNKWIVQKIDLTEYNELINREAKISQLEEALDEAFIKASRYEMYKKMADIDPTIKQLLDELITLDSSVTLIE